VRADCLLISCPLPSSKLLKRRRGRGKERWEGKEKREQEQRKGRKERKKKGGRDGKKIKTAYRGVV